MVIYFIFSRFSNVVHDPSLLDRGSFLVGMVTCHSLTVIDGEISGDPLDLIMFKSTKWVSETFSSFTYLHISFMSFSLILVESICQLRCLLKSEIKMADSIDLAQTCLFKQSDKVLLSLQRPGPSFSKLTTLLINVSLKFQTVISEICQYFLLKK